MRLQNANPSLRDRMSIAGGNRLGASAWSASNLQLDDFRSHAPARHANARDGDRQLEAAGAGTAGIEEQDAAARLDRGAMGMAEQHGGKARGRGVETKLRNLVQHQDPK